MHAKKFVDSNILVYAHDSSDKTKQIKASQLLRKLWEHQNGVLSVQVLQEFYVSLTKCTQGKLPQTTITEIINDYTHWQVVVNDSASVMLAIDTQQRYQLSFWDALIICAAVRAKAEVVYSEDLNHGQCYDGVIVLNPFIAEID